MKSLFRIPQSLPYDPFQYNLTTDLHSVSDHHHHHIIENSQHIYVKCQKEKPPLKNLAKRDKKINFDESLFAPNLITIIIYTFDIPIEYVL